MKGLSIIFLSAGLLVIILGTIILRNNNFAPNGADAASNIIVEKDIAYGSLPKQKLDLCKPKSVSGKVPGVILVHGGGGDKSDFLNACKELAKNGLIAITVNFRETPPPSWKVILEDNRRALAWLKARNDVDSEKIGAMGGSAGAYVASMMGTTEFENKVNCVENNFGPTDFSDEAWGEGPLYDEFVDKFFGGVTYEENPELYKQLSPITHASANDANPWFFTRSTNDQLVPRSQMTKMIDALENVGISTEFYEYEGTGGGHANNLPPLAALQLFNKRINFLVDCLSR
ncbi:hypothetical protein A2V80_00925 [Candidatus Woesebacteria bacterium RBG_16_39_8b]|uniref:BD-FAE-like domain-containing protein n=1 Tax=Candidatus Woesebacteria bacterium RBG_16_39_8b TaxID=1802482 RepID=A0A1F7XC22_9BACT|nr:MAG: hypothetical protein A2V80_00925 [Candidatus Woesebacteria bacterium RBG_16_39_8b]